MDSPLRDMNKKNCKKCEGSGIISVPQKDWRDGDYEVAYCPHLSLQKESEWYEKIEKVVEEGFKQGHIAIPSGSKWLRESLSNLLSNRENEIEEEVVKLGVDSDETNKISVDDVLQILKH